MFLRGKVDTPMYTMMFHNAISLKVVVRTYMGGATKVYNGKNILGTPLDFSFIEYHLESVSEKSAIFNLVSNGTNFVLPS